MSVTRNTERLFEVYEYYHMVSNSAASNSAVFVRAIPDPFMDEDTKCGGEVQQSFTERASCILALHCTKAVLAVLWYCCCTSFDTQMISIV